VFARRRGVAYYTVAVALIVFGAVGLLSIGLPFLVCGVALLAHAPNRHRPEILWPPLAALAAWTLSYAAVAPWGCGQATSSVNGSAGSTVTVGPEICRTAFGVRVDDGLAGPAIVALLVASVAFVITRIALARRSRRGA
jgi:hypothetical protein